MKWMSLLAGLSLCWAGSAGAQAIGEVTDIQLLGGTATITLDLSVNDYELILYPTIQDEPDTARTFSYTVSSTTPSSKIALTRMPSPVGVTDRDRLESVLRRRERELADRLDGQKPSPRPASKIAAQVGDVRTFTFSAFGDVTEDRSVETTLVATSDRATAYLDDALPAADENVTITQIEDVLTTFSTDTYPVLTTTFGTASDVDADGKVVFLFTHLVDDVGGIAGFYSSSSLFSAEQGGNGNLADMMFISPTRAINSYESLLAHEFQHLINYNEHVLVHDGDPEESWMNEALSHVTEDLVGGHVEGGNPTLIEEFMRDPGAYRLNGDALLNSGIRGSAYLFLRGLIEDFGEALPGQLVQTDVSGIPNVEATTGQDFETLYRTFVARVFLSGTGLSEETQSNYTFPFFTETTTGHRSIPPPGETVISNQVATVSSSVKPLAPEFIRVAGTGIEQSFDIQTEVAGSFQALLVALPKGFIPSLSLPSGFFPGIVLDAPFQGGYTEGEAVTVSGSIPDSEGNELLFQFVSLEGEADTVKFIARVADGRFGLPILFSQTRAGKYNFQLFLGQTGATLPFVGGFSPVVVDERSGPIDLPVDFFAGITLDSTLPTHYEAGTGISLSGVVSDPSVEALLMTFTSEADGQEIRVQTVTSGGQFRKGFLFTPDQTGTYSLDLFGGLEGESLFPLGSFDPVTITSSGNERISLPVDFFDSILLDLPLPGTYLGNKTEVLSGRITESFVEALIMIFNPNGAEQEIRVDVEVSEEVFHQELAFTSDKAGSYTLDLFGGSFTTGEFLLLGSFPLAEILIPQPDILVRQASISWEDVPIGESSGLQIEVVNAGNEDLVLTDIGLEGDLFSVTPMDATVSGGDSITVTVTFTPASTGAFTALLEILSNDPDQASLQVSLTASAIEPEPSTGPSPDFDGDGKVGFLDFVAFALVFNSVEGDGNYDPKFDLDNDEQIGFLDFVAFSVAFEG